MPGPSSGSKPKRSGALQACRTLSPLDSKPYEFDSIILRGRIAKRLWDDNLVPQPTGAPPFEAAGNPSSGRTNELPLDRDVVQFGS